MSAEGTRAVLRVKRRVQVLHGRSFRVLPAWRERLAEIVDTLLEIPHIRRIRIATKGPAVMPMKILTDTDWTDTIVRLTEKGRKLHKEVCLHTHFNCTEEITDISRQAMNILFERGVKVRNQSVLVAGVNGTGKTTSVGKLAHLLKALGALEEARPLYERALRVYRAVHGPDHPWVATALSNLGALRYEQDTAPTETATTQPAADQPAADPPPTATSC